MARRTPKIMVGAAVVALSLLGAACSSGRHDAATGSTKPSPPISSSARPAGRELRIAARDVRFDVAELAAPAGVSFTVIFGNRDQGITHNLAVYRSGPPATGEVAKTQITPGPATQRLAVPPLEAGRYFYQCDIHPATMTGTLVVS